MNLSFIVPSYMGEKHIPRFFDKLKNQTNKDFEIIFIIDNAKSKTSLNFLQKLKTKYKDEIKILFNTKRQKRLTSIIDAINYASGEYIAICSTHDSIENNFVEKVNHIINKESPDVIEYKFQYLKFKSIPLLNTPKKKLIKLKKDYSVIANTIPFDFNKVIKKSVAKKAGKLTYVDGGSRFDFSFIFNVMTLSDSYYALDLVLKHTQIFNNSLLNPRRMMKIINSNIKDYKINSSKEEFDSILFFSWNALAIYQMQALVLSKKTSPLSNLFLALSKMVFHPEYRVAVASNPYFQNELLSSKILKSFPDLKTYKKLLKKWEI